MASLEPRKYGILAGQGDLTKQLLDACVETGQPYFVIGFQDQADPQVLAPHPHVFIPIGKVAQILKALRDQNATHVILAGRVHRPKSWAHLMPDLKGLHLLKRIIGKPLGDDGLFRILVDFLENEGFQVCAVEDILGKALTCPRGVLTKIHPDEQDWIDIRRGWRAARLLGQADIGQSVIVQQGIVIAVEAVEGTDHLIERAATLKMTEAGGVLVKVLKPEQEARVDRSTVGPETVAQLIRGGFRGMALQADEVILLAKERCLEMAEANGFFIIGITTDDIDTSC